MKAKDWAESFRLAELTGNFSGVIGRFVNETRDLIVKRGGSAAATEGAIREQLNKFAAIKRLLGPGVGPDDWLIEDVLAELLPEEWSVYCKITSRNAKRRYQQHAVDAYHRRLDEAREEHNPKMRIALIVAAIVGRHHSRIEADEIFGN